MTVDAATAERVHATYLHVDRPVQVAWDPGRDGVWVLASTFDTRFPLTPTAGDPLFCEPGSCTLTGCATLPGQSCRLPQEIAFVQVSGDGRTIRHATYIGGPGSDSPRALHVAASGLVTVLGVQERLGAGFSHFEHGTRQLTVLRPESGLHRGPLDDPLAARTSQASAQGSDPRYGDLHTGRIDGMIHAHPDAIPLHPVCAAPTGATPPCFQLVWLPHLGSIGVAPQPVPLARATLALLALALTLGTALALAAARRSRGARAVAGMIRRGPVGSTPDPSGQR